MAVQTNIASDSITTSFISLHGWYYSDAGTPAVRAEFYCDNALFATEYASGSGSSNWTTSSQTKSGLSPGTTYAFRIDFFIADGRKWGSASSGYTTASLPAPPEPPYNITTSVSGLTATISFTKGARAYYTHLDAYGMPGTFDYTTTGTQFVLNVDKYNYTYQFDMISEDQYSQVSAWTPTYSFTTGNPPPPGVPSSAPSITGRGDGSISLSWGSGTNATSYTVAYKKTSLTTWSTVSASGTSTTISGLAQGTSYDFKVCSVNNSGSSAYTSITTAYTNPDIPTIQIVATTANSITIKPTIMTGSYDYIQVYEYNASGITIATVNLANNQEYTFAGLTTGTTYKYNGRTYSTAGGTNLWSGYSSTVQATTTTRPADWVWTTSFYSGKEYSIYNNGTENYFYIMPATEWNDFLDKIAAFRTYCGLAADSSLYHMASGSTFNYQVLNRAIRSIDDMSTWFTNGYTAILEKTSDSELDAAVFLSLRDTLNSINRR